jgi:predicted transcriptional regulator
LDLPVVDRLGNQQQVNPKSKCFKTVTMEKEFINPIDKDKIAENPHLLPYAHTVGGAVIKPIDKGKVKGRAVTAMYEQTDMDLDQIRQQIELLASQAKAIQNRVNISERIYLAEMNFGPIIGKIYHLYRRSNGKDVMSMISPGEWGKKMPYDFVATIKLLADHTWDILATGDLEL